jgi:hypothetical protein
VPTKRFTLLFFLAILLLMTCAPLAFAQSKSGGDEALIPVLIGGGCACCGGLVSLGITAYVCYFMYTDATARGQNGVLWALIGLFGGLVGLIIWLVIRPEKKGP